jgi:hypothetical protein
LHAILPAASSVPAVFLIVPALALAYGIARAWSGHRGSLARALTASAGIALAAVGLHMIAGHLLTGPPAPPVPLWLALSRSFQAPGARIADGSEVAASSRKRREKIRKQLASAKKGHEANRREEDGEVAEAQGSWPGR